MMKTTTMATISSRKRVGRRIIIAVVFLLRMGLPETRGISSGPRKARSVNGIEGKWWRRMEGWYSRRLGEGDY